MDQIRRIKTSSFVTLVLLLTVNGKDTNYNTARVGDEVTLPCGNGRNDPQNCNRTSWIFCRNTNRDAVELITEGKISFGERLKGNSERLSVTSNCSLIMKNVTVQDVGRYTCRQFNGSGKQQGDNAVIFLSVVNVEQHGPLFICSVLTYSECWHTVQWIYEFSAKVSETTKRTCGESILFNTTGLDQKSNSDEFFYCKVTDNKNKQTVLWSVDLKKTESTSAGKEKKAENNDESDWWKHVLVAVGLAAPLIILLIMLAFIRQKKAKGKKSKMGKNDANGVNHAVTPAGPEVSHELTDPEDGVSYASVNYTKKKDHKAQANGDDEGSVTYSTVKVSSPAGEASSDPSSLYATIHRTQ